MLKNYVLILPNGKEAHQDLVLHVHPPARSTDSMAMTVSKNFVVQLVDLTEFTVTVQPVNGKDSNYEESIEEEMAHFLNPEQNGNLVVSLLGSQAQGGVEEILPANIKAQHSQQEHNLLHQAQCQQGPRWVLLCHGQTYHHRYHQQKSGHTWLQ